MDDKGRIMAFLVTVLSRLWNLPAIPSPAWRTGLVLAAFAGWVGFPLAMWLSRVTGRAAAPLAEPVVLPLRRLRARLGVWGVTGNHEYYAGLDWVALPQSGGAERPSAASRE